MTVIVPHDGDVWAEPIFAGTATLNGNGEMTGLEWVRESGLLTGAIGITNTSDVGKVRDALTSSAAASRDPGASYWALPVAGETYDGQLNDIAGGHVQAEHVAAALAAASSGPVAEGNVGGGTGMICHEFKGGIGTSSRRVANDDGGWTVGVLVQANYGRRGLLRIDGVPVGEEIGLDEIASPWGPERRGSASADRLAGAGSIIGVVATDAPLLPHQCARLARRMPLGLARVGGLGSTSSGDIFLAFATGNRGMPPTEEDAERRRLGWPSRHGRPGAGPAVRGDCRGDRGGDRQRAGRRRDDGRARRHDGASTAARPPHRGDAPVRTVARGCCRLASPSRLGRRRGVDI